MIYRFVKRFMDIVFSLSILLILLPFFLVVIFILRFTAEGEVFYLQQRVGFKNVTFKILKFVTMVKNSANIGSKDVTLRNDPRVLPFGKLLRISKINELPQLFNILKGDISFVGPRPLMRDGFERYSDKYKKLIYSVKPGLTGIGSIVFRDEEKIISNSELSPHDCYEKEILPLKGALELWYISNQSFLTDIKIIFVTAWVIIFPKSKIHRIIFAGLPNK